MSEQRTDTQHCDARDIHQCMSIHTRKITDSCRDKDCIEDLRVYPTRSSQAVLDSTRYDSLFLRSNGFVSMVQILGAVMMVTAIVLFSIRMVKNMGFKWIQILLWVLILGALGAAGYMEYYVQRHGNEAAFAYTVMGAGLAVAIAVTLVIRGLGMWKAVQKKQRRVFHRIGC